MQQACRHSWCKHQWEITAGDLAFYENVSPVLGGKRHVIPPPTLCPDCRNQRRMTWRNDRTFYRRKCDLTSEEFISIYPADSPFTIYKPSAWYGDGWDPLAYGRDVDLNRSFFEQLRELQRHVPRLGIDVVGCENSDFCNYCGYDKNCYLDIAGENNEDCYYNLFIKYCKNCTDCTFVYRSTLCYECINCHNCYECGFSEYLEDCSNCSFCFDCKACKNCLFCINLRGKEYCIGNTQYAKEGFIKKLRELGLSTHSGVESAKKSWRNDRLKLGVFRDMYVSGSENCTGNDIKNSKNCHDVYNVVNCEDCKYLNDVLDAKDCQDLNYSLYKPEVAYETCSTLNMRFSAFNYASHFCANTYYSDMINHSQNIFGCNGLTHKQYCILNKQYLKESYEELVPKIIGKMIEDEEWGEFFPSSLSPFKYNETVAQEYFPLSKEEAKKRGLSWSDSSTAPPQSKKLIRSSELPDSIEDIPDDVLNWAIQCEPTDKLFKVIRQELEFYRRMKLPIPHASPDERHRRRTALRNPRRLWERTCEECGKMIRTSYSPERPEKVLCEECYLKKVY